MAYTVTTALGVFLLQTTVDSLKINYMDKGSGELVVLLHGWGSNIELFENMSELLARKYHVIAPDMPGFGLSDEPEEPWRVDDYVDFVLKFLEPFAPEKVTFLGHSFGGRVIIKMASRKLPFEIEKVILVDSAGVKPKKTAAQKLRQRNYKIGRKILETAPVKALFPDALEEFRRSHGSVDYNSATPVMRQTLVNTVNEDIVEYMPNMKMPVLLVWGENDDATPLSDAKIMEQLMPDAGLVTLKNCGHYSFLEQQFTFNKVLASFMEID